MKKYWLEFKYLDCNGKEIHRGFKVTELTELSFQPETGDKT